jgi:hypothetical protein
VVVGVVEWCALLAADCGFGLRQAAAEADVCGAEASLSTVFPADLRGLYVVSDGVYDRAGQWFVVWPIAEVVARNRAAWNAEDAGRRRLLGFGDDGTGAPFCILRDGSAGVYVWNPIDAVAYRLADTIAQFWTGWADGTLKT